jgi:hypothetical protein
MRRLAILCTVAPLCGCSLSFAEKAASYVNSCSRSEDCGPDGACVSQSCVATKADLASLYLELSVPSSASAIPGTTTLLAPKDLDLKLIGSRAEGFVEPKLLLIPDLVTVDVAPQQPLPVGCSGIKAVPTSVTLYPGGYPAGIAVTTYSADPSAENDNHAKLSVPAGRYDVYLEPHVDVNQCRIPPSLIKGQKLEKGTVPAFGNVGQPATLSGSIDIPIAVPIDPMTKKPVDCAAEPKACWRLQLLDNQTGRVIGTDADLKPDLINNKTTFALAFWQPGAKDPDPVDPVLVLTPSDERRAAGMPVVLWKLVAIDPNATLVVDLQVSALAQAADNHIACEASVLSDHGDPVPSTVVIQSKQILEGQFGDNALLQVTTKTDAEGKFKASLLPGSYDIVAIPGAGSGYALTVDTWTFGAGDLGKGRTFTVQLPFHLNSTALTPKGEGAAGISVLVSPASGPPATYLQSAFPQGQALLQSLAHTATTETDPFGRFTVDVDPGLIDVSLHPPASSNLPWLVRPQFSVQPSKMHDVPLTPLSFTNPVVLRGRVTAAGAPNGLPGVSVRAWLALPGGDPDKLPTAVAIGETQSDGAGNYRLLLPASVSQ